MHEVRLAREDPNLATATPPPHAILVDRDPTAPTARHPTPLHAVPRLIRLALTFFVSATLLVWLLSQRIERLQADLAALSGPAAEELAEKEGMMIGLGQLLAGLLVLGGFVLIFISLLRKQRSEKQDER